MVELNATFYRRFPDKTYEKWRDQAPEGFRYALKAPRAVSHRKDLRESVGSIQEFCRSANLLEGRLGPILLQVGPSTRVDPEALDAALAAFDPAHQLAVEFRNDDWLTSETREVLDARGAAFVSVDSPRNSLMDWITGNAAYIRLHGRGEWFAYDYSDAELEEMAGFIRETAEGRVGSVYLFVNCDIDGSGPRNARSLQELLAGR